jgi:hypothetical protein
MYEQGSVLLGGTSQGSDIGDQSHLPSVEPGKYLGDWDLNLCYLFVDLLRRKTSSL